MLYQFKNIPKIALIGQMGAGKDYLAALLGYQRVALSDPIKKIAQLIREGYENMAYSILAAQVGGTLALEMVQTVQQMPIEGKKDRKALQYIGETLNVYGISPYWLELAMQKASLFPYVIITDCRRKEEFTYLKDRGFFMIGIQRPEDLRIKAVMKRDSVKHETVCKSMLNEAEKDIEGLLERSDLPIYWNIGNEDGQFIKMLHYENTKRGDHS